MGNSRGVQRSDVELIAAVRAGDSSAMDELYRRHHSRLVDYCRPRLGGDARLAAEIAHDALVRSWERLDRFYGSRFDAWVLVIARHLCMDHHRRAGREMSVRVEAETHAEDPADLVARRDAVQFVRDAVDTLAPHQARAVRLHLAEESNLATAAALGLEPNAANQLLHRARVALRSHLAHLEGTIAVLPGVRQIHAITTRAQAGLAGMPLGELPALAAVVVLGGAAVSSGAGASVTSAQPPRDVVAVVAVVPSTAPPVTVGAPVVVTSPSEPPAAPLQPESVPTTATTTPTPPPSIDFIVTWYPGPEGSAYVDERIECMPIRIDLRPIANIGLDPAALLEPGDDPPFNPDADC